MILAAPQNEHEFVDIERQVQAVMEKKKIYITIAGFRSETNNELWISGGKKLNFNVNWHHGQPDNRYEMEHCYGKKFS